MRRTTIHISAALALLLGFAACTQDEAGFLPEGAEGTPIVFTATGLNPDATVTAGTRAPVDGNWQGVTSVAVLIDGTVKAYDVTPTTADNTSATLTSTDPHYWADHNDMRVTAWWPYTAGETAMPVVKVRQDQSTQDGYEGSDFIAAEEQAVSYANPTLRFTHRTARVTVALTDCPEESMNVRLTGLSTEGGNPAVIAPYNQGGDTYTALVAPQTVAAGTAFITCTFTSGKSFVYRMQKAAEWKAGEEYTYTVSLAAAKDPGYTDDGQGNYTALTADGLKNIAKLVNEEGKTDINITLSGNLTLTGEWTPIGTSGNKYTGTFEGGGHTITGLAVTTSDQYAGLFGYIGEGGTVKDVTLEEVQIATTNSYGYAGGVAGYSYDGKIENCSVSGSVSGNSIAGGVVGTQFRGSITECNSLATVKGVIYAGGIAGETNSGASLTGCYATGDVSVANNTTNNASAGGVVGYNGGISTLTACYATGSVSGTGSGTIYVGGVTGSNLEGTLIACYHANGTVSSTAGTTGGVAGQNYKYSNDPVITACYWGSNNQTQGIGDNQAGTGGTTQVDGDWQNAVTQMNAALSGKGWQYELKDGNSLPTLKKKQ